MILGSLGSLHPEASLAARIGHQNLEVAVL